MRDGENMNRPGKTGILSRLMNSLQQPTEVILQTERNDFLEKEDEGPVAAGVPVAQGREAHLANIEARRNIVNAYKYGNRPVLRRLY